MKIFLTKGSSAWFSKKGAKNEYNHNFKYYDYVTVIITQKDGMTF